MNTIIKTLGTRIAHDNGSRIYCSQCGNAVAVLSDSHSDYFKYHYKCNCGNQGSIELGHKAKEDLFEMDSALEITRKRMRCPNDDSPLLSILDKNVERFEYEVICKTCGGAYHEKI